MRVINRNHLNFSGEADLEPHLSAGPRILTIENRELQRAQAHESHNIEDIPGSSTLHNEALTGKHSSYWQETEDECSRHRRARHVVIFLR